MCLHSVHHLGSEREQKVQIRSNASLGSILIVVDSEECVDGLPIHRVASSGASTRSLGSRLVMMVATLSCAACRQSPVVLPAFRAERQAQQHCPSDAVVSVDPQSGTYQLKGHGSYGLGCGSLCLPWRSRTGWDARDGELSVTGLGYWSQYFEVYNA